MREEHCHVCLSVSLVSSVGEEHRREVTEQDVLVCAIDSACLSKQWRDSQIHRQETTGRQTDNDGVK